MVEHVVRPVGDHDVALGIDVVEHAPRDLGDVVHVDVLVDDEDALGEHELPHAPQRVHDLAPVQRVLLVDGDDRHVVEHALDRQVLVDELGQHHA